MQIIYVNGEKLDRVFILLRSFFLFVQNLFSTGSFAIIIAERL